MTAPQRHIIYVVAKGESRLDHYLAGRNLGLTRSRLQRLIADGDVLVNGLDRQARASRPPRR